MRYQVLKNSIPICICDTPEDADEAYLKYNADEIREINDAN